MFCTTVVIATCKRNDLLIERSIKSVYSQTYSKNVDVVVCVDAEEDSLTEEIRKTNLCIENYREKNNITNFPTKVIGNSRTKFHSGTGAWNSAVLSIIDLKEPKNNEQHFIAILDDDDSWDQDYLMLAHKNYSTNAGLIVSGIKYIKPDNSIEIVQAKELTEELFFVKNPGVFGSNMFVNLKAFLCAGGFDESMRSTTDRDFLMRYVDLSSHSDYKTIFCDFTLVNHFADEDRARVTSNKSAKKQGLDLFYYKYQHFKKQNNQELLKKSLDRAEKLFGYKPSELISMDYNENSYFDLTPHKTEEKINLIIGLICFEPVNFARITKSVKNLTNSKNLNELYIYVLTTDTYKKSFIEISDNSGLDNTHIIIDADRKKINSIAENRTELRKNIYKFIDNQHFAVWIIDDDLEFYNKDYIKEIAYYKEQGYDLLYCPTTNEPPLPFLLTLRRSLTSYYYMKKNNPDIFKGFKAPFNSEFYYDLTEDFRYLELPVSGIGSSPEEILKEIKKGKSDYTIDFFPEYFGCSLNNNKENIVVGGNCIILNKKFLLLPNFVPDAENYNRRSDFNWSILCIKSEAKINRIYLPLAHKRETEFNLSNEIKKIKFDLIGNRFYRAFYEIVFSQFSYEKITDLYDQLILELKQKLYFNLCRIEYFVSQIDDKEIYKIWKEYSNAILEFCADENKLTKQAYDQSVEIVKKLFN